LFVYYTE